MGSSQGTDDFRRGSADDRSAPFESIELRAAAAWIRERDDRI